MEVEEGGDAQERVVAGRVERGVEASLVGLREHPHRLEQDRLLRLEVVVHEALVQASHLGHPRDRGAVVAALGQEVEEGLHDLGPAGFCVLRSRH